MIRLFVFQCLAFIGLLAASPLLAESLQVCSTCELQSLTQAIEGASDGAHITLKKGIYLENGILVDKPLTIQGEEGAIVDGENKGAIFRIEADNVEISGLTIRNVKQSHVKDYSAILVHRSRDFSIHNNTLEGVFFGIVVQKSKGGFIANNRVSGKGTFEGESGNGIHIWHSSDVTIEGNELSHLRDGIYFEFVKNSIISKNSSHDNLRYGLHFMFSNNNSYLHNDFNKNGAGVAVMFSKYVTMTGNTFRNNWGSASYGLLLKEIYDAEIVGNVFEQNTIAINAEGSTRINYTHNNFIENGWAIKVRGACYENTFSDNNFLQNAFDVSYNSQVNDNSFEHNYWSSYTGYDLNKDGIGDVPHRPIKLFSYIVNRTPETIVLLRSLFIDILDFSEKVSPVFTPDDIIDERPAMKEINIGPPLEVQ